MKKLVFAMAAMATLLGAGVALHAERAYGTAGCGLGSIVIGNDKGIIQIFAATTNGTTYNQFFGITSGTSNCTADISANNARRQQEIFVHVNYRALQQEMAAGGGDRLSAFAGLLGCPVEGFAAVSQREHGRIFTDASLSNPGAVIDAARAAAVSSGLSCSAI